jgi:hypothetical protein
VGRRCGWGWGIIVSEDRTHPMKFRQADETEGGNKEKTKTKKKTMYNMVLADVGGR